MSVSHVYKSIALACICISYLMCVCVCVRACVRVCEIFLFSFSVCYLFICISLQFGGIKVEIKSKLCVNDGYLTKVGQDCPLMV